MRGGPRKGAGRKSGVRNKKTAKLIADIEASGETPMDYMLRVMRDTTVDHKRRDAMASAVAPYVHAKLASIEHAGAGGGPIQVQEIRRIIVDNTGHRDGPSVPPAPAASEV